MSLLEKYIELKINTRHPNRIMTRRFWDPDFLMPDTFFVMDEVKGRQILRMYNTSSGKPVYAGTYLVIFKTEDMNRFCLIMKRIKNEWKVPAEYVDRSELEQDTFVVAEYYPGTHCRIYMRGLGEQAVDRIVKKYEQKTRRKLPFERNP